VRGRHLVMRVDHLGRQGTAVDGHFVHPTVEAAVWEVGGADAQDPGSIRVESQSAGGRYRSVSFLTVDINRDVWGTGPVKNANDMLPRIGDDGTSVSGRGVTA